MRNDVLAGLRAARKQIAPKYFYDAHGAALFEQITRLDAYYLTRSELAILEARVGAIASRAGPRAALIEYGSGAGIKVRRLLDALDRPAAYVPIDISGEQLRRVAASLRDDYPDVDIHPLRADYTRPLELPHLEGAARTVAFFPGSTIGNLQPQAAAHFLRGVRQSIGPDGALVLGVDRRKDPARLEAAYNDPEGVTAAFNRNLLVRLNRELRADFAIDRFRHLAFFNAEASRIEMHLESTEAQVVTVAGAAIPFEAGETIWTESSYKYDEPMLERLTGEGGFRIEELWTDPEENFWLGYLAAADTGPPPFALAIA
jgi:dimethylhistidine N-methyltransferase